MPRKSNTEKANEAQVERPATRRSIRLSASSPAVTPQQTRAGNRSSSSKATPSSVPNVTTSPKTLGKKGAGDKVSTPKTSSRGRNKGRKEPEEPEEIVEQKEQEKDSTGDEDSGKGQKVGRQGNRGKRGVTKETVQEKDNKKEETEEKEKVDVAKDKSNAKQEASDDSKAEAASASGRPRRGKQVVVPASEEPSTPRRGGRSRGKESAEKCFPDANLGVVSSPSKGVKRKRTEIEDEDDLEKGDLINSPKKPKTEELPNKEEDAEKMDVDTTDQGKEQKEDQDAHEQVCEASEKTQNEPQKLEDVSLTSDGGREISVSESMPSVLAEKSEDEEKQQLTCSASEEATAAVDFRENGLEKVDKATPDSNPISGTSEQEAAAVGDACAAASSSEKTEETFSNGTNDDVLLTRNLKWFKGELSPSKLAQSFSIVSYNILADCHAQRDFTGPDSWIAREHLAVEYRHSLLMREIRFLDGDIICLQEVEPDYFTSLLKPALAELGYDGQFVPRHATTYVEGEATFFRTKCFSLEASQSLVLSQVAEREIDESDIEADVKSSVKDAVDSYAVTLLTRLKCLSNGMTVTCANIHVAYDKFERQDKQCLQLACAIRELVKLAGGPDKPHFICGDFNSWPDSPPYQLVREGHLSEKSLTALQSINSVSQSDGQMAPLVNYWSEGFQYSPADNLRSAYVEVLGTEPLTSRFNFDGVVRSVDYVWFSSNTLEVQGVMETVDAEKIKNGVPNTAFPSDHLSLKAVLSFK